MKKIVKNKKYIQIKDILFIKNNELATIPNSLYSKMLMNGNEIFSSKKDNYLKIETEEENKFFDSLDYIYDKKYLDNLSYEEIESEISKLEQKNDIFVNYRKNVLNAIKSKLEENYSYNELVTSNEVVVSENVKVFLKKIIPFKRNI